MFAPDMERVLRNKHLTMFERHQMAGGILTSAMDEDPECGERALVALYNLQTKEEQKQRKTMARNWKGLSKSANVAKIADLVDRIKRGDKLLRHANFIADVVNNHRDQYFTKMTAAQRRKILTTPCARCEAPAEVGDSSSSSDSSVTVGSSGTDSDTAASTDNDE